MEGINRVVSATSTLLAAIELWWIDFLDHDLGQSLCHILQLVIPGPWVLTLIFNELEAVRMQSLMRGASGLTGRGIVFHR
jgi:hypothetical protein